MCCVMYMYLFIRQSLPIVYYIDRWILASIYYYYYFLLGAVGPFLDRSICSASSSFAFALPMKHTSTIVVEQFLPVPKTICCCRCCRRRLLAWHYDLVIFVVVVVVVVVYMHGIMTWWFLLLLLLLLLLLCCFLVGFGSIDNALFEISSFGSLGTSSSTSSRRRSSCRCWWCWCGLLFCPLVVFAIGLVSIVVVVKVISCIDFHV